MMFLFGAAVCDDGENFGLVGAEDPSHREFQKKGVTDDGRCVNMVTHSGIKCLGSVLLRMHLSPPSSAPVCSSAPRSKCANEKITALEAQMATAGRSLQR